MTKNSYNDPKKISFLRGHSYKSTKFQINQSSFFFEFQNYDQFGWKRCLAKIEFKIFPLNNSYHISSFCEIDTRIKNKERNSKIPKEKHVYVYIEY